MEFEEMSELQYRELELDALEERKKQIIEESRKADSKVSTEVLEAESKRCIAEFARREAEVQLRNTAISAISDGAGTVIAKSKQGDAEERGDIHESAEYRRAFMEFVCRGKAIPQKFAVRGDAASGDVTATSNDAVTHVSDATAVVPTTLMNEIIKKMDTYGEIWAKVRKLNVKGGVKFPIVSLVPTATWVDEDTVPDTQKGDAKDSVVFSYYQVEARFAQTLLQNIVSLDAFNAMFVDFATEAIVKAVEAAIIKGDGNAKPLGILNDTRVAAAQKLTLASANMNWEGWHSIKAKMKKAYRNGVFIMNQATFDEKIDGMVDKNGQPIARVNYGINGEETYRFMGKEVLTVEDDLLPDYSTAASGDVFAIFVDLSKYAVNTNQAMTIEKWYDPLTKKHYTDGSMICDGKLLDPYGVLLVKKGA